MGIIAQTDSVSRNKLESQLGLIIFQSQLAMQFQTGALCCVKNYTPLYLGVSPEIPPHTESKLAHTNTYLLCICYFFCNRAFLSHCLLLFFSVRFHYYRFHRTDLILWDAAKITSNHPLPLPHHPDITPPEHTRRLQIPEWQNLAAVTLNYIPINVKHIANLMVFLC